MESSMEVFDTESVQPVWGSSCFVCAFPDLALKCREINYLYF